MRSDMKKLVIASCLALAFPLAASAAVNVDAVRAYTLKSLEKCPDSKLDLKPVQNGGPAGFQMFDATLTSSDKNCGRHVYILVSPITQQVLIGTVFPLAAGPSTEARVSALASDLLQTQIRTQIVSSFPLPDGIRAVSMYKETPFGPFAYHGFIDSTSSFLIVGSRGNLTVDPGRSLVEALNASGAGVQRGNKASKVEIIELSDFQCPTCGRAHKKVEPLIEKNLKKVNYTRLDLPLFEHHEWSLFAALGARAINKVAPAKYWDYVNFVFGNQETISQEFTSKSEFDTILKDFCSDHDIDYAKVEKIYKSPQERAQLMEQTSHAFDNGINSTPTYIVNGQVMGFGPEGTFTINAIRVALGLKPEPPPKPEAAKPAAKPAATTTKKPAAGSKKN
jgi:protein-disulfide isomerase